MIPEIKKVQNVESQSIENGISFWEEKRIVKFKYSKEKSHSYN